MFGTRGSQMAKIKKSGFFAAALALGLTVPAVLPLSAASAAVTTVPFMYTGSAQTWTVPAGVTEVELIVVGSSGTKTSGGGHDARAGAGAVVTTTQTVTPGAILTVNVGGGTSSFSTGGAATVVKAGSTLLAVAGGGGGGGSADDANGGDGAENGTAAGGDGKGAIGGGQGAPGDGSGGAGKGPTPVAGGSIGNNGTATSDRKAGGGGGGIGGAGGANTADSKAGGTFDGLSRQSAYEAGGPGAAAAGGGAGGYSSGGGGGGYGGGGGGGFVVFESSTAYSGGGAGGSYAATPPVGAPATVFAPGPYSYLGVPYGLPGFPFSTAGSGLVLIKYTPLAVAQTVTFGTAPTVVVGGTGTASASTNGNGAITYTSGDTSACTVSSSTGVVTGVSLGTDNCTITATAAATSTWLQGSASQTFSITAATVTFNANGGSGTMSPQSSTTAANLTVNTLTRTGYTFTGWNTAANGSGTAYGNQASFPFTANTTLYAQWTINQYVLSYFGNGNTSGSAPTVGSLAYNSTVTVAAAGSLTKSGYVFTGWNTEANGSGTAYQAGAMFAMPASAVTLYAQWAQLFTVTFDANGGSGPMSSQTSAAAANLTDNAFVRAGYTFSGWNTAANGSGTAYGNQESFPFTADTTLFAQWLPLPGPVTFTGSTFGTVQTNTVATTSVTVTNTGLGPLTPTAIAVTSPVARNSADPGTCATSTPIAAGGTCTVNLVWSPAAVGSLAGVTLTVAYDGGVDASNSIAVAGTAVAAPPVTPAPAPQTAPAAPKNPKVTGTPTATKYTVGWKAPKNATKDTRYQIRVTQRGSSKVLIFKTTKKRTLTLTRKQLIKAMQRTRGDVAGDTMFRVRITASNGLQVSHAATAWLRIKL